MNFKGTAQFQPLNVAALKARYDQVVRLSTEQASEAVLETAESIVPVRTGYLRESGHTEVTKTDSGYTGAVIFDEPYARYVEEGTGIRGEASPGAGPGPYSPDWPGQSAQPFARDALAIENPHILEIFQDNLAIARKLGSG